jgi:tetratricopeptide (TPR) repeat protein
MDARFPAASLRLAWALCPTSPLLATSPAIAQEAASELAPTQAAVSAEGQRTAEEHLARGLELYGQKHYTEAVEEFRAGYAINADVRLLYTLAQALRLAGQCTEAVTYYQRFLDSAPSPAQEAAARANLQRCRERASSADAESPREPVPKALETPPPPAAGTPRPQTVDGHPVQPNADLVPEAGHGPRPPPASTDEASAWYADILGAVLTGGGVVGVGAGVTLLVLANSARIESERLEHGATQGTYQQHADHLDTGRAELVLGGVSTAVGLTAMAFGALRYHHVASRRGIDVALTVLPSRASATLGGTF